MQEDKTIINEGEKIIIDNKVVPESMQSDNFAISGHQQTSGFDAVKVMSEWRALPAARMNRIHRMFPNRAAMQEIISINIKPLIWRGF